MATSIVQPSWSASSSDEAAIKTNVESVATLADLHQFEALETLYAEEVLVDYTSLSGGEVELKSAKSLMTQWASVLPGFDRTRHQLSDTVVDVQAGTARATTKVSAEHFVENETWLVEGTYTYQFEKVSEQWKITAHRFQLENEVGSRNIISVALANAQANPADYLIRIATQKTVKAFLSSLETKDMDAFAELWAEDAIQEMPYSPDDFPKKVVGKPAIVAHYAGWPQNSGEADFTSALVFYPMQDPEVVFVEFSGDVDIVPTGRRYQQRYGGLFHVENGKIKLFREYFDPAPFKYAFGL